MTRTVCLAPIRVGVAGVAAAVLLAACGGGSPEADSATPTPAAEQSEEGTAASEGAEDFCAQAAGIDQRVDAALSDLEGDDPSVTDAFRQIATELRGIDAPDAIRSDWEAMAAGLDRMADAFAGVDSLTDLDSLEGLEQAEGDLTTASRNVDDYLADECGL
jgi:ABC-type glycerol-3-phosphate transport system substrate-binding protein